MPDVLHFDPDAVLDAVVELFWRQGVASTGVQDVVAATGVNRSSLYATFGSKRDLYVAALRRYLDRRSRALMTLLVEDGRGVPAVADFFAGLVEMRCSGDHARWGCMIANAHTGVEKDDPDISAVLREHHSALRAAFCAALEREPRLRMAAPQAADLLALLSYGISVRTRGDADQKSLNATVSATLAALVD